MRELKAKASEATKDSTTDVLAIAGNWSLPQLDIQSSTRVKADDDAETRRYAITYNKTTGTYYLLGYTIYFGALNIILS